ncbi:tyrosine-type recombinase/integrase [Chloroflexota bacterium]
MTPASQQLVINLIQGLADRENVPLPSSIAPGLQLPEEGISLWFASLKAEQYSPRTIEAYSLIVKYYLKRGPVPTLLSIQSYLADRLGRVSSAKVSMERKALRSFFRFLHSTGLWLTDPTANIKSIRVRHKERELPSEDDIAILLKAACFHKSDTPKFHLMVTLLLDTGLRVAEACSIRKGNIDFEQLEIKVIGKGSKERVVPMSLFTASILKAWIEQDGQSEWLFSANNALGYWDERSFEKTIKHVCKRHGIKPITPHALRHFFATHNLKNGARLEIVSKLLGHASVAVTADIYCHINLQELHDAHQKYSPLLGVIGRLG